MFTFKPCSEKEVSLLLPRGQYKYMVHDSFFGQSKSTGSDQLVLILHVHSEGQVQIINDYIVLPNESNVTSHKFLKRKLRHFCYSCGLEANYEQGSLPSSKGAFNGRKGIVDIGIKKSDNNPDKNIILDYIISPTASNETFNFQSEKQIEKKKEEVPPFDDDLPAW